MTARYAQNAGSLAHGNGDDAAARGARIVAECKAAVKDLAREANSATSFREKCSNALGAALGASLALQEALSSANCNGSLSSPGLSAAPAAALQHISGEVQVQILGAEALVRKYGHEGAFDSLLRWESKEDVEAKFDSVVKELNQLAHRTWDLIDPDNRLKRSFKEAQQAAQLSNGRAFTRHSLRFASQHKVQAMLWHPDDVDGGVDGVVAWAAHRHIKLFSISTQVTTTIAGAAEHLSCMAHDASGFIWSGHDDGTVRVWSPEAAGPAGDPVRLYDCPVTAMAVDPDTGYCWAGSALGEVAIVRFKRRYKEFGKLEYVRTLLGYDAHSPASSQQQRGSFASSLESETSISSNAMHRAALLGSGSGSGALGSSMSRSGSTHRSSSRPLSRTGMDLLESCLPIGGSSSRLKDSAVHMGEVTCIVICQGRAYTAGGGSKSTAQVLVWDSAKCELLRTISKRSSPLFKSACTAMVPLCWNRIGRGSSSGVEMHLVTGHASGEVIMWDPSNDTLKPVLRIVPGKMRGGVRDLVVCDDLGLLCVAYHSGRVAVRKLDPGTRLQPRGNNVSEWAPKTAVLNTHRLGLHAMVGGGHLLVTAGSSGSVKIWPETSLRCAATEAGIRLPQSDNVVAEALNSLLGGQFASSRFGGSSSGGLLLTPVGSAAPPHDSSDSNVGEFELPRATSVPVSFEAGRSVAPRHRRLPSSDDRSLIKLSPIHSFEGGARNGEAAAATVAAAAAAVTAAAAAGDADGDAAAGSATAGDDADDGAGGDAAERAQPGASSSGQVPLGGRRLRTLQSFTRANSANWPQGFEDAPWMLKYEELKVGRLVGEGSYGRVRIGSWNETEVAIKILSGLGVPSDAERQAQWDDDLLRSLRKEVGILAHLRHPNVVLFLGVCLQPPCVVTEYCPLGSLYDVLRKARKEAAFAARLTWSRRLLMALDAAKGLLYLHTHKPAILHRDLKSPNLFVDKALHVKVGDFNLSRYLGRESSFVKSSLENNPRWSAPEVITEGRYSKEADVYAFGVVMWELLTWQEPWDSEGLNSYQIMTGVKDGVRPSIPPIPQLPGGPCPGAEQYIALMKQCWAPLAAERPTMETIICRLKAILIQGRAHSEAAAIAAAHASASPPARNVSDGQLGARAAEVAAAQAPGAHKRSASETAAPIIGDLLNLVDDDRPAAAPLLPPTLGVSPPRVPPFSQAGGAGGQLGGISPKQQQPLPPSQRVSPFARPPPFAYAAFPAAVAAGTLGAVTAADTSLSPAQQPLRSPFAAVASTSCTATVSPAVSSASSMSNQPTASPGAAASTGMNGISVAVPFSSAGAWPTPGSRSPSTHGSPSSPAGQPVIAGTAGGNVLPSPAMSPNNPFRTAAAAAAAAAAAGVAPGAGGGATPPPWAALGPTAGGSMVAAPMTPPAMLPAPSANNPFAQLASSLAMQQQQHAHSSSHSVGDGNGATPLPSKRPARMVSPFAAVSMAPDDERLARVSRPLADAAS